MYTFSFYSLHQHQFLGNTYSIKFLKEKGSIPEKDFWNTFNLGVGFCLIIDKQFKDARLNICKDNDIDSWVIGKIVRKYDLTISKFLPDILP